MNPREVNLKEVNWVVRGKTLQEAREGKVPILVCVHGFMGGPEDFTNLIPRWEGQYCIVIPDFLAKYRKHGIIDSSSREFAEKLYDDSADQMAEYLKTEFSEKGAYFFGVSLGGKIIYDFAARFPDQFLGAVITDMGPGKLEHTDLYHFLVTTVPSLNLNQEWPELRKELHEKIPERNVRILVQTQIHYPHKTPPAAFRPGLDTLQQLIDRTVLNDQMHLIEKFKRRFIVLKASHLTAIEPEVLKKMQSAGVFEIRWIPSATHFLHFTHLDDVQKAVLDISVGS